jgi:hypothetical protein
MSCEEIYSIRLTEANFLQLSQPSFEWDSDSCLTCVAITKYFNKLLVEFNISDF